MAEAPQKKTRRLRAAPQTMRERAEREANKQPKQRRVHVSLGWLLKPFRRIGRGVRRVSSLKIWRPVRFVGRILGRILFPRYLRRSFAELRQVTWPNRKQTFQLTSAVILFSVIFGLVVALFDFGLDKLFKQVILR